MTKEIQKFIKDHKALVCPACEGEGESEVFSGHYHSSTCHMCAGKGIVKSLRLQKNSKTCDICKGRAGGCGGCNHSPKGLIEWKSYEPL